MRNIEGLLIIIALAVLFGAGIPVSKLRLVGAALGTGHASVDEIITLLQD